MERGIEGAQDPVVPPGKPGTSAKGEVPVPDMLQEDTLTSEDSGVSTTTIIIAISGGVGGLVAVVTIAIISCVYCRGRKVSQENLKDDQSPINEEEGLAVAHALVHEPHLDLNRSILPRGSASAGNGIHIAGAAASIASDVASRESQVGQRGAMSPLGSGRIALARMGQMTVKSQRSNGISMHPAEGPHFNGSSTPGPTAVSSDNTAELDDPLRQAKSESIRQQNSVLPNNQTKYDDKSSSNGSVASQSATKRFDMKGFEIDFKAIQVGRRIGQGSFGTVYAASWNETPVAVKLLAENDNVFDIDANVFPCISHSLMTKLEEEAGLMASLRHPNIVQFMGISTHPPCVITEFCERGSLADVLKAGRQNKDGLAGELTWHRRISMAVDAAKGMLHLHAHKPGIVHRDLKSPNLLVDSHWRTKVADFNLSRLTDINGCGGSSAVSSMNPRWLAPELLGGEPATQSSDVFAFGIILWELLTWELPWGKNDAWSIGRAVGNGARLSIPSRWNLPGGQDTLTFAGPDGGLDDFLELLQICWSQNPFDRPNFEFIIQSLRRILTKTSAEAGSESSVSNNTIHSLGAHGQSLITNGSQNIRHETTRHNIKDLKELQIKPDVACQDATSSISSTAAAASMNVYATRSVHLFRNSHDEMS